MKMCNCEDRPCCGCGDDHAWKYGYDDPYEPDDYLCYDDMMDDEYPIED